MIAEIGNFSTQWRISMTIIIVTAVCLFTLFTVYVMISEVERKMKIIASMIHAKQQPTQTIEQPQSKPKRQRQKQTPSLLEMSETL
jgi:ABC-type transport system involved in Fe-S cluster assembly fused permease/ATPase subunit